MNAAMNAAMARAPVPAALLALLLAGCAARVPPEPAATLQPPVAWRAAPAGGNTAATVSSPPHAPAQADARWWHAYGDPALSSLVDAALAHNGDLRIAQARVAEYRARVAAAQSAQQPNVSYDAAPARARALTATGAPRTANAYVAEFQAA